MVHLLFGAMATAAAADDGDDVMGATSPISPMQDVEHAMAVVRVAPGVMPGDLAPSPPGQQTPAQAFTPMAAYVPMMTLGTGRPAGPRALAGPSTAPAITNLPASGRTVTGGAITSGRTATSDAGMPEVVARTPPQDLPESQAKRGRSIARPSSPRAALPDVPTSQVVVRQQMGDGSVEMALSLRGQEAHTQWAYQEAAPQRIAILEETVMRLEAEIIQMRMSVETHEARTTREKEQFAHVAAYVAQRIREMAQDPPKLGAS